MIYFMRYVVHSLSLLPDRNFVIVQLLSEHFTTNNTTFYCRYKAEVDVDGRELARYYLSQRDINAIMAEIKAIQGNEDLERFMLKHGENIVDCLGEQVDRIEKELKSQHPELRHVDLEVL